MDFDQLATFVYVAKLKSFSRAGQKVFRSQSAVSAQIRQLEQAYRARLLDRSAKSVELTPAGEVLFDYAERLLRLRDESIQFVADRGDVVQGPLVFGANEATCLYLLPDIFAEIQRKYPEADRDRWLRWRQKRAGLELRRRDPPQTGWIRRGGEEGARRNRRGLHRRESARRIWRSGPGAGRDKPVRAGESAR